MPRCGDCKHYQTGMIDDPGMCTALWNLVRSNDGCSHFERRLTMEKTITISQDRFEYFLRLEVKFELARSIYRNNDTYRADDMLATVLGPRTPKKTKDEPQEQ